MRPEVRYARNGDVAIGYMVVGEGDADLVYLVPFNNLDRLTFGQDCTPARGA